MSTRYIDNYTLDLVNQALAQQHTITACKTCGGPEIHSLRQPISRCFGCDARNQTDRTATKPQRRQCRRCKKYFRSRTAWLACESCRSKMKEGRVYGEEFIKT